MKYVEMLDNIFTFVYLIFNILTVRVIMTRFQHNNFVFKNWTVSSDNLSHAKFVTTCMLSGVTRGRSGGGAELPG